MIVNGWTLITHPLFDGQFQRLKASVDEERKKKPEEYVSSANFKLFEALSKLVYETVPGDPSRSEYRLGNTLGADHKNWFRVKFGGGRFRLFFRYDSKARVIVYAWVNDEETKRTYGSKTDAYGVFRKMLDKGNPPKDWKTLVSECHALPVQAKAAKPPQVIPKP